MIEKLSEYKITSRDGSFINVDCNTKIINTLVQKINELVDAVNSLRDDCNLLMGYIAPENKCEPAENGKFAKIAQDPYAEQRKWIGKLCRFWDDDAFVTSNDWAFGILTSIDKGMQYQYCCNENCNFKHCEPVKPDDDIIYKGGDNEQ